MLFSCFSCSAAQRDDAKQLGTIVLIVGGTVALGGGPLLTAGAAGAAYLGSDAFFGTDQGISQDNPPPTNENAGDLLSNTTNLVLGESNDSDSFFDRVFRFIVSLAILAVGILTLFYVVKGIYIKRNTIFPAIGRGISKLMGKIHLPKKGSTKKHEALNKSGTKNSSRR